MAGLVAGRLQALAAAGIIRLREVTVRLADPAAGWLPLAALDRGHVTDPSQLTRAHEVRRQNDRELAALFDDVDVLVTPTTPQTAFPLRDYEANLPAGHLCWAFNLSGHLAVTVPVGLLDGHPVGLQAVAAPHREDLAVELAELAAVSLPDPPVHWRPHRTAGGGRLRPVVVVGRARCVRIERMHPDDAVADHKRVVPRSCLAAGLTAFLGRGNRAACGTGYAGSGWRWPIRGRCRRP